LLGGAQSRSSRYSPAQDHRRRTVRRGFIALAALLLVGSALFASPTSADDPPVLYVRGETLKWTSSGTQNVYRLLMRTPTTWSVATVAGRTYTPPALEGTTVKYRVKAAYGESAWSNPVSIEYPGLIEGGGEPFPEEPEPAPEGPEPPPEGQEPPPEGPAPAPEGQGVGDPNYWLDASSYFDRFASLAYVPWVRSHVSMIKGYPPFSDIYVTAFDMPVVGYHDPSTEGFSPLTSASIERYVGKVKRDAGVGYAGTFIDDVNWGSGYRDGDQSTSLEPEERKLADLIEAVHRAVPEGIIEINSQYHDIWPKMKAGDPNVERALRYVDVVNKEFGVGPSAGISTARDYAEFFQFVDALHAKGIHVSMAGDWHSVTPATMEYNLATYFLASDGSDFVGGENQSPQSWWNGFNVKLGDALGPRERSPSGVWTRKFSGGVVYTVEPGAPTQTIRLGKPMHSAQWGSVEALTLAPGQGAVLVG
jgi:hypothetical protein